MDNLPKKIDIFPGCKELFPVVGDTGDEHRVVRQVIPAVARHGIILYEDEWDDPRKRAEV
jgi:hypothetical protein